mgnify:CR=1 FL=1
MPLLFLLPVLAIWAWLTAVGLEVGLMAAAVLRCCVLQSPPLQLSE